MTVPLPEGEELEEDLDGTWMRIKNDANVIDRLWEKRRKIQSPESN